MRETTPGIRDIFNMWRVSIEAGEAYSGPLLIPGDNDGRAGYSTGGEFENFLS